MSTPAFPEIDTTGISAMRLPDGQPEILLLSRHGNQMNMIRHQTIDPYIHSIFPAPLCHEINIGGIVPI